MYYPPYGYPPMYIPPTNPGEDPIQTYQKVHQFLEALKKEADDKKKNEKKKPDPRKFSFAEVGFFCMLFGPLLGFGYLYTIKLLLLEVDKIIK